MQWVSYKYKWCNECVTSINDAMSVLQYKWCNEWVTSINDAMSVLQV